MLPSWRLTLNLLSARRWRTALMVTTVILSAGLVAAVGCAVASLEVSTEVTLRRFIGSADIRLVHAANGRFEQSWIERVAGWPEVVHASGRRVETVALEGPRPAPDAEPDDTTPATVRPRAVGIDFEAEWAIRTYPMAEGRRPEAATETMIDDLTAEALGVGLQDRVTLRGAGETTVELEIVGRYRRQRFGMFARPRIYVARAALDRVSAAPGEITSIYAVLEDGADPIAVCAAHGDAVPEAMTLEPAEDLATGFDRQQRANRLGTTILTMLTVMCSACIVLTCLTTGVTERQRQMAVLRCLGAERRQLFAAQLFLGSVIGGAGGLIGAPFGIALAWVLTRLYPDYLPEGLAIGTTAVILAVLGALAGGTLGALYPAWSASRVPPLQALARPAAPPRILHIAFCAAIGVACIGLQAALLFIPDPETRYYVYVFAGLPLMLVGWFVLSVPALVIVARVVGPLLSRALLLPGDLLAGAMTGTPFRHGFTAGALMAGMALLVGAWTSGQALQRDWLDQIKLADGFVFRPPPGVGPDGQDALGALDAVVSQCPIGFLPATVEGRQIFGIEGLSPRNVICIGFESDSFFDLNQVEWREGDPDTAIAALRGGRAILVEERFLLAADIGLGDELTLTVGRRTETFDVAGVITASGFDVVTQLMGVQSQYMEFAMGCVFVDFDTLGTLFDNRDALLIQLELADGVDEDALRDTIEAAVPGAMFHSATWITDTIDDLSNTILTIYTIVAFAALILASLAVGNVLAANVEARSFELGVLRAIGVERMRLLRLLLAEALLLALTAILIGSCVGLYAAAVEMKHMRDFAGIAVDFAVPWQTMGLGALVLIAVTLLVAAPSGIRVVRPQPSTLLARGRNE